MPKASVQGQLKITFFAWPALESGFTMHSGCDAAPKEHGCFQFSMPSCKGNFTMGIEGHILEWTDPVE